ncbi:MAG TPA: GDSL-type esterase/lipase family protein [Stellaceae bacterium]|nr:GDSL-type esterase/lipase family protein [Stellaceae bacterium]
MRLIGCGAAIAVAMLAVLSAGSAAQELRCSPFTPGKIAEPKPREAGWPVHRFDEINAAVKRQPYRVLFFGDSITEGFDKALWQSDMAPRGVLNAGVSGDRTEHLMWRLQHGNLDGPPPAGVALLIGTNDLGHGRSPSDAAQGIRADLLYLRQQLPQARILLLGLWPRAASPGDRLRRGTVAVNQLIRRCGDGGTILYADIGDVLLDGEGGLSRALSPDLLHFSPAGYARLTPPLDSLIDKLLAGR